MKKHIRSRVLAVGIAGALLAGGVLPLIPMGVANAQSQPSAQQSLSRGSDLIGQKDFTTAKKVLLAIDPSQLSSADRTTLGNLLVEADKGIAASAVTNQVFQNAQSSLEDGHLAHAASLYQQVISSPDVSAQLKQEAQENLALTQAKQKELAPAMGDLLNKAIAAYNSGNLAEADADLNTIRVTGADLGDQNAQVSKYQVLIAQKRVAEAQAIEQARAKQLASQQQAQQAAAAKSRAAAEQTAAEQAAAQQKAAAAKQAAAHQAAQQKLAEQQAAAAQQAAAQKAAEEAAAKAAAEKAAAAQQAAMAQAAAQKQQEAALLAQQQQAETQAATARAAATQAAAAAAARQLAQQQAAAAAQAQAQQEAAAKAKAAQEAAAKAQETSSVPAKSAPTNTSSSPTVNSTPAVVAVAPAPVTKPAPAPTPAATVASPATKPMMTESQKQVDAQRASILLVAADDAVKAAQYQKAITMYTDAMALDPSNQAAVMGRNYAEKLATGEHVGLLSQTLYNQEILSQRATVIFNNDLRLSSQAMAAGKYAEALDHANDAEAEVTGSRNLFSQSDYAAMLARAREQIAEVQNAQQQAQQQAQIKQAQQVAADQQSLKARLAAERANRVNQLMGTAEDYLKQQQYQQALDTLNQVIEIDPTNNSARFERQMVQDQIEYNKWNHYNNLRSLETQKMHVRNEEEVIPYQNLLIYPSDWPELSRLRENEQTVSQSPADQEVERRLAANVHHIVANQTPFENVIDTLRSETGTNIVVNWSALEAAGVEKTTPVTLTLRDVPFKKVLQTVLQQVQGGGGTQLGYSIDEGVITISTHDQLAQQQVVRVYDIQDLLVQAPNFKDFPTFNLQSATQNSTAQVSSTGGGGIGNAGGGGGLFGGGGGGAGGAGASTGQSRKDLVSEITKLIENTVDRNSWVDNGGTVGTIRELNGQLVINQAPGDQQKIAALLTQLREARSIEISIEARFLLVSTNFLNDFGLGWNLTFNNGFFGNNSQPLTITNNTASTAIPETTGIPGSLGANTFGAGTGNDSLDVTGGFGSALSSYQLNLLLRATQEDKHSTTLTAPRVTLFNGQSAYITVTEQQNFVSSFTQTAGAAGIGGVSGIGTNLNISTLSTGVVLAVTATVSADHRYVVMTLQPSLSTLDGLDVFNITGQATTGGTGSNQPGFVQLPKISLTQVATTVSVPDGGTLLIGGQRLVGEVEVESGVPVLSKIPLINRLFTNRTYVRDSRVLLILVRPRIIIQKEWEKNQFGQNY
ncbi:MAG: hypothetical protein HKL96_03415 [Phycisphaerales bacterium]|nr:hypothetical protein [Phycisphaerales bacterium]